MPRSITRTLRVEEDLDAAVAKSANDERVSVNFIINRQLRRYVDWDIPALDLALVTVPKMILDKFASRTTDENMELDGREVTRDVIRPATLQILGEFSVSSVFEIYRRSSLYGGRFHFDFADGKDNTSRVFVIRHDSGPKWSRYYYGSVDEAFRVLLRKEIRTEYTDSLVIAQLRLS